MSTLGHVKSCFDKTLEEIKYRGLKFGFLAEFEDHFKRVIIRVLEERKIRVSARSMSEYTNTSGLNKYLEDITLGREAEKEFKKLKKWLRTRHATPFGL